MVTAKKINHINTHVVDILGSTKGRDQPIMKMDKAVELVKCLGEEVLVSDEYVFFDPFCKAGEILLATALLSTIHRKGKHLVSQDEVAKEMYESNRYFALAPDERHYYLSRRTFYGNEKSHAIGENSNIRNGAYLSEIDGRLDRKKFQKELEFMLEFIKGKVIDKKIITIGNPPYQERDGGGLGTSAKSIYNIFFKKLVETKKIHEINLVIPSRWFTEGKGLDNFRKMIINSGKIKKIIHFENSREIFPSVDINGGICFINWKHNFQGETTIREKKSVHKIYLHKYDIIIPCSKDSQIIDKVLRSCTRFVKDVCWPRNPFKIKGKIKNLISQRVSPKKENIKCYYYDGEKRIGFIKKSHIEKNQDKIPSFQVAAPKATINRKRTIRPHQFFILGCNEVSSETYSVINTFNTHEEAKNFLKYLQTNFARYMFGLRKISQNISMKTWSWVPLMDTKTIWTDEKLFDYFGITREEEKYIKEKVDYWTA